MRMTSRLTPKSRWHGASGPNKYGSTLVNVDMQDFPGVCQRIMELATKDRWISVRDLNRGCQNFLKKGGDLGAALDYLVKAERLRVEVRGGGPKGGRPSDGYALCD